MYEAHRLHRESEVYIVCVYTITQLEVNPEQPYLHLLLCSSILCLTVILMQITHAIIRAKRRNVDVRVITDKEQDAKQKDSKIRFFRQFGIEVQYTTRYMHTKVIAYSIALCVSVSLTH